MPNSADPNVDRPVNMPFPVSQPKLLTSKPRSQVFQCDYTDESGNCSTPCIVKIFSSRARVAYEKELTVYLATEFESVHVTPSKIWSGSWSADQYRTFLAGKLPSILRRQENQVSVIVLTYLQNASPLSRVDSSNRLEAIRVALRALLRLHEIGIVHGDPSADNVLMQGVGARMSATWIDFSSSITNPSEADITFEQQKAVEYYSQYATIDASSLLPSELEESTVASPTASDSDDLGPIPLLPEIPPYITFSNVEYVAEGTHAVIYKVMATGKEQHTRCLKLFHENWDTPYLLETTAYAYLDRAGVEKFIPKIYGCGLRPRSGWGLRSITEEEENLHHGILMEWIEDAEVLSEKNITIDLAVNFIRGLIRIHDAGILHSDTFAHNMLVVPGKKRSVWIDFSCAKIGADLYHDQETGGAAGLALGMIEHKPKR